jgi:hypothetical protein
MLRPPHRVLPFRRRGLVAIGACVLAAALAGCGGGGGSATPQPPPPIVPGDDLIAQAVIGPGGGTVEVATGPHAGTRVVVPAGALATNTSVSLWRVLEHADVPSVFPVYRVETGGAPVALPVTLVARASEVLFVGTGLEGAPEIAPESSGGLASGVDLVLFWRPTKTTPWSVSLPSSIDEVRGTVAGSAGAPAEFVAWNGGLHRLFTQDRVAVDPAVPARAANLFGVEVSVGNGAVQLQVGRGSLSSFFASPAAGNVLIVHGLLGSPLDFLGVEDLVEALAPTASNVVVLSYPSAPGVAVAANDLYDLLAARRQPGFGCSIVAHSLGGLVGRYLVERSAGDPQRRGFLVGDAPASDWVHKLVLIGVPNAGSAFVASLFDGLMPWLPARDLRFVRARDDLAEGAGSFTAALNQAYVDNATQYHIVYGDLGIGSDGAVSVASATALTLVPPETATGFAATHSDLHRRAATNGVAAHVRAVLQLP